jgi:sulfur dioxygenase
VIFRQLFDRETSTFTYLVADGADGGAALVDPVREHVERDLKLVRELGLRLTHVFETHVHADHVTGAGELRSQTGAKTYGARSGGPACADEGLADGDAVAVGGVTFRVLATPGHTSSCLSYVLSPSDPPRVLTGDALLVRGCGRTDFQGGDAAMLFDSVHEKLFSLPDATRVYPAHDYRGMRVSTVAEEKAHNPRLRTTTSRDEFVAIMRALDLPPPAKIAEAVPANLACGEPTQ